MDNIFSEAKVTSIGTMVTVTEMPKESELDEAVNPSGGVLIQGFRIEDRMLQRQQIIFGEEASLLLRDMLCNWKPKEEEK